MTFANHTFRSFVFPPNLSLTAVDAPGSADQDASMAPPPGKDHSLAPSPEVSPSAEKQVDALDEKIEQAKKEDGVEAA